MRKYYKKEVLDTFSRKEASKLIESLKNIIRHQSGTGARRGEQATGI
jgi:hypothetical protein